VGTAKTWLGESDRHARLRKIGVLHPQKDYREITKHFYEDFGAIGFARRQSHRDS